MVKKRLDGESDWNACISKSLHLNGFLAFITGGTDAEHRECQQCGVVTSTSIHEPSAAVQPNSEDSALSQGLASSLKRDEAVIVKGLRMTSGKAFEDLEATVVEPLSLRCPGLLLVNIRFPDGSLQERAVPTAAIKLPSGRRRSQKVSISEPSTPTLRMEDDGTSSDEDTSGAPSVDEIMAAQVKILRTWSDTCDLDSTLKKPLLILNLCAFWHPEEFLKVVERMQNLEKFDDEVTGLAQGQLFRPKPVASPVASPQKQEKKKKEKAAARKEKLDELRRIHAALECSKGALCRLYEEERELAVKRLASMESNAGEEDLNGAGLCMSQLPIPPDERDEILYCMLLARERGATPVQRLTTTLFAVLRTEATSAGNSYSTPTGYSLVTMMPPERSNQLSYVCTCSQFRNVRECNALVICLSSSLASTDGSHSPLMPPPLLHRPQHAWGAKVYSRERASVYVVIW